MEYWYSFMYLYGIGGLLFAFAIYIGIKKKVLNLKLKSDRKLFIAMLGAYFFYFICHGIWNLLAILSKNS